MAIQHPATKRYTNKKFEDDRQLTLGLMGRGEGIKRMQSCNAHVTVSDMSSLKPKSSEKVAKTVLKPLKASA